MNMNGHLPTIKSSEKLWQPQGVRFFRPEGMGNNEYKRFVSQFTDFLDFIVEYSPSFEKTIVELSNGASSINMKNFEQGDRTVLAISPNPLAPLGESTEGQQLVADAVNLDSRDKNAWQYVGARQGYSVSAKPGIGAPSAIHVGADYLETFTKLKAKMDASIPLSATELRRFGKTIKALVHEVSHASAAFRATAFNREMVVRMLVNSGLADEVSEEVIDQLVVLFEEIENMQDVDITGRPLSENKVVGEMNDRGIGYIKKLHKYGNHTFTQILNHLSGL